MFIRKLFNRVEDIFKERNDPLIWSRELERHFGGSYSYACMRARPGPQLEFSHVELGSRATFVGIYDGHNDNILRERIIDEEKMTQAVDAMENQIIALSREDITQKRKYGSTFVTNQINDVDNHQDEPARFHFQRQHPEAHAFTADDSGVFLVKGKVKVTKSLGDAYLKYDDCAVQTPDLVRFHIPGPTSRPYLTVEVQSPTQTCRLLSKPAKFVIIASNGLWDFLSNEEATIIVQTHPKEGIARILIQEAQKVKARINRYAYINLRNNTNNQNEVHD
ncbi:probable protein phosphatase 2C 43 [Arachis duranensis]|uniref:Probable protein phosphatase 2C 43 n=1 Tax=Arachis duranensis TaxID=130453 RepID=A0A6P4DNA6_ARADU|nr:probable protein phosphatase 2C 43 [Arachis duranensis]